MCVCVRACARARARACAARPGTLVLANSKIKIEYKGKILFRTP